MKTVAVMLLAGASVFAAPTFKHDNHAMFDKYHNGKLEPDEREAFMKALGEMIR
jgi:hypothetical protein